MNTNGTSAEKDSNILPFKVHEEKPRRENYKANYKVGEKQEVYPFREEEDLKKMYNYFAERGQDRNVMLFVVGINVGLRAGDLLSLKWNRVIEDNKIVDSITIKEEKTDKFRKFYFNDVCKRVLWNYYNKFSPRLSEYVFESVKTGNSLDVRSAGKILKTAAKAVGIKYNVGTHSLRKTFGYHQLKAHENDAMFVCQLQQLFNHSSPQITLRYCGLEDERLRQYYNDVNLCE